MITVDIDLGARSYPIYIGENLPSTLWQGVLGPQVAIVTNDTLAPLYLETVRAQLGVDSTLDIILPDGEQYKNWQILQRIFDALIDACFDRHCTLVALGGGVVGDMTGYAAASYQRGVSFVQYPTTLLAQVDSSVGGKTGINHPRGKNMIGAFHQPRAVMADIAMLRTLPQREFNAGMAEVIKYGAIMDADFFTWLGDNATALQQREPEALCEAIARSCRCKAQIVSEDEREAGRRALLNFGHTYGHALEAATHYRGFLHGEAVAVGMAMAARFSVQSGLCSADTETQLITLLQSFDLPTEISSAAKSEYALDAQQFMALMSRDKKVQQQRIRLVLLHRIGDARVHSDYDKEALQSQLDHCFSDSK